MTKAYALLPNINSMLHPYRQCTPTLSGGKWIQIAIITLIASTSLFTIKRLKEYCEYNHISVMSILTHIMARSNTLVVDSTKVRKYFLEVESDLAAAPLGHTHGAAAANRASAILTVNKIASAIGRIPYYYQMSNSNLKHGLLGVRTWYWAKDTSVYPAHDPIPVNPLFAHIDVDYYIDLGKYLAYHAQPLILYTLVPEAAAAVRTNYSYYFSTDGKINFTVSGGAAYSHHLWNLSSDTVSVTQRFLGIPLVVNIYTIDRRPAGQDRQLVLFTPISSFTGLGALLAYYFLEHDELRHLDVIHNGFTRLETRLREQHLMSTAKCGEYLCATIPITTDHAIARTAAVSKYDLAVPAVQSAITNEILTKTEAFINKQQATVLTDYHRNNAAVKKDVVCPLEQSTTRYQFLHYVEDAKPIMQPFMTPFLLDAFVPDKTKDNERRAVEGRIKEVASDVVANVRLKNLMREFAQLMFPIAHQLLPVDLDYVMDKQSKPTQRTLLEQGAYIWGELERKIRSFIKAESYGKLSDPRVISTINPADKREYSRYIYAFSNWMKTMPWYAFAKTPAEIADSVVKCCESSETVAATDYERMDGTISKAARELEEIVAERAYAQPYYDEFLTLHRSHYNLEGKTSLGVRYDSGTSRASGGADTSDFNTLLNAFVAYATYRTTMSSTGLLTPQQSWDKLCLNQFGGDDGLVGDIHGPTFVRVGESMGLRPKIDQIHKGELGVKFLSRLYSRDVWFGSPNSMCDIHRLLTKLHITHAMSSSIKPLDKLVEKCRGIALMDHSTPIIGPYSTRVVELTSTYVTNPAIQGVAPYMSKYTASVQYPNFYEDWMNEVVERDIGAPALSRFQQWFLNAVTIEQLLQPIVLVDQKPISLPKADAIVNGEDIHYAPTRVTKRSARHRETRLAQLRPKQSRGPSTPSVRSSNNEISSVTTNSTQQLSS